MTRTLRPGDASHYDRVVVHATMYHQTPAEWVPKHHAHPVANQGPTGGLLLDGNLEDGAGQREGRASSSSLAKFPRSAASQLA
jgi:hypothetical protein